MSLIIPELAAIAAVDVAISLSIQRKISSAEKTYRLQKKLNAHMADLKEMTKAHASTEEMMAKQKEVSAVAMENTKHQMRSMPILLVISVAFYFFLLPHLFPSGTRTMDLLVTTITYTGFTDSIYFIIFTVAISFSTQMVLRKVDEKSFGKKYAEQEAAEAAEAVETAAAKAAEASAAKATGAAKANAAKS